MTKSQQIEALQAKLKVLPEKSPKRLWIRWKILTLRNATNRTLIVCGVLGAFSAGLIVRHVETIDRNARTRDGDRAAIDVARQIYDAKFAVYELEREERRECLVSIISRENFRSFIDTITNNLLLVAPNSVGAQTFVANLQQDKEENWKPIDPNSCGSEPIQPEVPEVLKELDVPVTTTMPAPTTLTITTTEGS